MTSSIDVFQIQGLNDADIQSDMTLRIIKDVNVKTNTALASLANLPTDTSSLITTVSTLVLETTKLKAYNTINVKEYGATGNGTTDDTTSIQSAITVLANEKAYLFFPCGTYKISSTLLIENKNYLTVVGDGANILCNFSGSSEISGFKISNCVSPMIGEGIVLHCVNGGLSDSRGITATGLHNLNLNKLRVYGGFKYGIYLANTINQRLTNLVSECVVDSSTYGIYLFNNASDGGGAEYTELANCRVSNCSTCGCTILCGNVSVTGGCYDWNGIGIRVIGGFTNYNPDHGKLTGVTCNHNYNAGIVLSQLISGFAIIGCQIWANNSGTYNDAIATNARSFAYGIYMEDVMQVIVSGCHLAVNKVNMGIDGWVNSTITNNIFFSNDVTVVLHIWEPGNNNPRYGSLNKNNIISNNVFTGGLTAGAGANIYEQNTMGSTNRNIRIKNNIGSTNNTWFYASASTGTYNLGRHDTYIIDVNNVYCLTNPLSTNPADQAVNIIVPPYLMGLEFSIYFRNCALNRFTWIRFATNSTQTPDIELNTSGAVVWFTGYSSLRICNKPKISFIPYGNDNNSWFIIDR